MAFLREDVDGLEQVLAENDDTFKDREVRRLLRHYETVLKRRLCLKKSPLPPDCWSDVLQCLTHPVWHELETLCGKFDAVLAPLLHHMHIDVQRVAFKRIFIAGTDRFLDRWQIALHSKSGRTTKVVDCNRALGDALLAGDALRYVPTVEIDDDESDPNVVDEGIVRFCFGSGNGRRLEIHQPTLTRGFMGRLVQKHSSAADDHEFTLIVTCPSGAQSDFCRQTTSTSSQYLVEQTYFNSTYEIASGSALLTIKFDFDVGDLDTMTAIRKRLIM